MSRRINNLGNKLSTPVEWFPVLLGGLYADTNAPQGKHGSASGMFIFMIM